jgi:hypothetical protein
VAHVWVHDDTVTDLVIDGQVITATEDHPFWSVTDHRFERADQLTAGEKVLAADGATLTVTGFDAATSRTAPAYNLTITDIHTYHVGAPAILVHNTCPTGITPESAANTAEAAADAALGAGRTSGAAAELRVGGQVFTDVSTGGAPRVLNGSVQEVLDAVPLAQRAPWHGACAEMGCLSQALNAGVSPAGGSIRAVAIGTSNPGHGLPKVICTSCSAVLDVFGVGR